MSSAGSTQNARAVRSTAKKLIFLGALLTIASQVLSSHLIYVFSLHYKTHEDFLLEEGISEKHVVQVSEADVSLLAYNLTVEIENRSTASLDVIFLGEGDRVIEFIDLETSEEVENLTGEISIDGYLESVVLSVKGDGWRRIKGSIALDYTKGQPEFLLLSIASAVMGIIGVIALGYSLIIYIISKGETPEAPKTPAEKDADEASSSQ